MQNTMPLVCKNSQAGDHLVGYKTVIPQNTRLVITLVLSFASDLGDN